MKESKIQKALDMLDIERDKLIVSICEKKIKDGTCGFHCRNKTPKACDCKTDLYSTSLNHIRKAKLKAI